MSQKRKLIYCILILMITIPLISSGASGGWQPYGINCSYPNSPGNNSFDMLLYFIDEQKNQISLQEFIGNNTEIYFIINGKSDEDIRNGYWGCKQLEDLSIKCHTGICGYSGNYPSLSMIIEDKMSGQKLVYPIDVGQFRANTNYKCHNILLDQGRETVVCSQTEPTKIYVSYSGISFNKEHSFFNPKHTWIVGTLVLCVFVAIYLFSHKKHKAK
ncbi:hypothetical protein J7J26_03895 [Candidatus Micrarchaeota archaeon]|nr:hypothetical protein [Candidatus Micrarchaeota archaeon]